MVLQRTCQVEVTSSHLSHSGRLYTRYQRLPHKRYKIRINTLINGEPICEVDFNANHLRLAMAVLHNEDAGDSPYEDIMAIAGIDDRDLVKSFITTALGAASKRAAQSSWNKKALGSENFVVLEQAVKQRYPKLILFDDWGINAQNIEGCYTQRRHASGRRQGHCCLASA